MGESSLLLLCCCTAMRSEMNTFNLCVFCMSTSGGINLIWGPWAQTTGEHIAVWSKLCHIAIDHSREKHCL